MSTLIPIERITANPWQTRQGSVGEEYIKDLALDIAKNGLLQIPVGRLMEDGKPLGSKFYDGIFWVFEDKANSVTVQLAFGHNRLAAFKWLRDIKDHSNLDKDFGQMEVELRELSDEQMADFAWSENEKRSELTPLERALAIEKRMQDFGWNQKEIAERLGVSQPVVSNALRLLKLPNDVQSALLGRIISERQAAALLGLYELPEPLERRAERGGNNELRPSAITKQALGGASSDVIRDLVTRLVSSYAPPITWADTVIFAVPPARPACCDECEYLIKRGRAGQRMEEELCGDAGCFEIRLVAYRAQRMPFLGEKKEEVDTETATGSLKQVDQGAVDRETGKAEAVDPVAVAVPMPPEPESETVMTPVMTPVATPEPPPASKPRPAPAAAPTPTPAPRRAQQATPVVVAAPALDWRHSTIVMTMTLMPDDENIAGRAAMVGLRANNGIPLMRMCREENLELAGLLVDLLAELKRKVDESYGQNL